MRVILASLLCVLQARENRKDGFQRLLKRIKIHIKRRKNIINIEALERIKKELKFSFWQISAFDHSASLELFNHHTLEIVHFKNPSNINLWPGFEWF